MNVSKTKVHQVNINLKQATTEFFNELKEQNKSERSLYTYGKDIEQILEFFGNDKLVNKIMYPEVSRFMKSDILLKKKSKDGMIDRAKPTIVKTIRIFRMLMIFCLKKGYINYLPLTKDISLGLSKV